MQVTDRRGQFGERRLSDRRTRLVPALVVVALSVVDVAVAQVTRGRVWSLLFIAAAIPVVAYDLATPSRGRSSLTIVWLLVVAYVMAATAHITWMVMR